jgi:hypothetical protein
MAEILHLLESLRAALDSAPCFTEDELAARAGVDKASGAFQAALRLLDDRLEILVDPAVRTIRGRRRLTAAVVEALADGAPTTQCALRETLDVGTAALADVVGWLQREGRVEVLVVEGVEKVRLKRGHSGPKAL